jgi:hypothetical protein
MRMRIFFQYSAQGLSPSHVFSPGSSQQEEPGVAQKNSPFLAQHAKNREERREAGFPDYIAALRIAKIAIIIKPGVKILYAPLGKPGKPTRFLSSGANKSI